MTRDHRGARRRPLAVAVTAVALIGAAVAAPPAGAASPAQTTFYHSRRDLRPPKVDTTRPASGVAGGYIFSSPSAC